MATRPFSSIPGPREIPFIGSIHRRLGGPLDFFVELQATYGEVVRFTLFREKVILFNNPEMVQEILVTKQRHFHKGRALEGARSFLGNSLLVSEDEDHARQRRLIQPAFHHARIAGYARIMAQKAHEWAEARQAGETFDLVPQMNRLTLAVVGETLFGTNVESEAQEIAESLTVIVENFNRMFLPFWRQLKRLPTQGNRALAAAQKKLDSTVYRIICRRREEGGDRGDLLSMLLAAEDTENPQKRLTDTEVRDQALTLFLAGHETTANALSWTWYLLSQHEPVHLKMRAELETVLGPDRLPGLEDMPRLPYTRAVFAESMRLYPPAWVVGRRAMDDVTIGNYAVPKRTIVVVSQYLIHRDPRFWPNPEAFQPERWLDEEARAAQPKFAYFPFGGGARSCIGESFAWAEGVILLAVIARRWRFERISTGPRLLSR